MVSQREGEEQDEAEGGGAETDTQGVGKRAQGREDRGHTQTCRQGSEQDTRAWRKTERDRSEDGKKLGEERWEGALGRGGYQGRVLTHRGLELSQGSWLHGYSHAQGEEGKSHLRGWSPGSGTGPEARHGPMTGRMALAHGRSGGLPLVKSEWAPWDPRIREAHRLPP